MHQRHVLFLQGPLGPFFSCAAAVFSQAGFITHRIVFNGGDRFYAGGDYVVEYQDAPQQWAEFLTNYLQKHGIESVLVMGDCRFYHRTAKPICERLGIHFLVFEEGYLRPNTITLEEHGVNANSELLLTPEHLSHVKAHSCQSAVMMGNTMGRRAWYASAYYWAAWFAQRRFARYQHHRHFHPITEGAHWVRGFFRKISTRARDKQVEYALQRVLSNRFFLVALQVHDDSQVRYHSDFSSVEAFIETVMTSFAQHAAEHTVLVLKHHPMDRGYTHYGRLIAAVAKRLGVEHRVIYCHDLRLPSIYHRCLGVVTINSTVGPSALLHQVPVKVMGRAMYDIEGLTSQGSLDDFWQKPEPVNIERFHQLQTLLFDKTQINGSFFTQLELTCNNVLAFYEQHYGAAQQSSVDAASADWQAA